MAVQRYYVYGYVGGLHYISIVTDNGVELTKYLEIPYGSQYHHSDYYCSMATDSNYLYLVGPSPSYTNLMHKRDKNTLALVKQSTDNTSTFNSLHKIEDNHLIAIATSGGECKIVELDGEFNFISVKPLLNLEVVSLRRSYYLNGYLYLVTRKTDGYLYLFIYDVSTKEVTEKKLNSYAVTYITTYVNIYGDVVATHRLLANNQITLYGYPNLGNGTFYIVSDSSIGRATFNGVVAGQNLILSSLNGTYHLKSYNMNTGNTVATLNVGFPSSTNYTRLIRNLTNEVILYSYSTSDGYGITANLRVFPVNLSTSYTRYLNLGYTTITGICADENPVDLISNPPVDNIYRKRLIAVGNNKVYYENASSQMTELTTSAVSGLNRGPLSTLTMVSAFEGYGKAFFVNGAETSENLGRFRVADWVNTRLRTTDIKPSGKSFPTKGMIIGKEISSQMGDPKFVIDNVICVGEDGDAYVFAKKITTGSIANGDVLRNQNDSVRFTASAAEVPPTTPHWYDWRPFGNYNNAAGLTYGQMPNYAAFGCLYRGRAVLAGDKQYPHVWYMSRQGNPFDWAYMATDAQSPVAGNNADAGEIGDIITCLAPYKDDYLIIGCVNSIWVIRGDPAAGGSLDEISLSTGIFGPFAYCWDNNDNFYFFGSNGLFRVPAGLGSPQNLSIARLPKLVEELELSPATHRLTMGFDRNRYGILICATKLSSGDNVNFWFDLRTEGFFKEIYPNDCSVFCQFFYEAESASYRKLLLGCADSRIRTFDETQKYDDKSVFGTEAISSKAAIGPIQIGNDDQLGRVLAMAVTMGAQSDTATCKVYVKRTAEECADAMQNDTGAIYSGLLVSANRVKLLRPRARGAWLGIVLSNSENNKSWQLEKIAIEAKPSGYL